MLSVREARLGSGMIAAARRNEHVLDHTDRRASARRDLRLVLRVLVSLAFIAATTFIFIRVVHVNPTTAGFLFLVAILLIATKGGLVESTVASVAAMLCFNFFFLPPVGTLTIADPQNWVALFAFLATSLTASQLSARAKRRAVEAEEGRGEVERLYALSRGLLLIDNSQEVGRQIVQQTALTCEIPGVALYVRGTGELFQSGLTGPDVAVKMRDAAVRSVVVKEDGTNLTITPVRLGGEPIGSIGLRGGDLSDAALQSLLNLVAIALERANSQKAVTKAEVARQSEELKSTLLDAIAHEFKTPLTSIKAVTTDLLSGTPNPLPAHLHELISIVDESTDRLSKLVTDAIQLARIEGGTFRLNVGIHLPDSLIHAALRQMKSMIDERKVDVILPEALPPVRVDAELIQVVLTHLLDNALKYSAPDNPIIIGARMGEGKVIVYVSDMGKGISEAEQAEVFERFYRGTGEKHVQGTGMGLAIAREIVRAHGEDIALTSTPGKGSEFSFGLPIAPGATSQ